jgi:hypothetical protein
VPHLNSVALRGHLQPIFSGARDFGDIPYSELAELEEIAACIERRWPDPHVYRKRMQCLDARMAEVRQLLSALPSRFPTI